MISQTEHAKCALAMMTEANEILMNSLQYVKEKCSDQEYTEYQAGMAQVVGQLFFLLMEPIYQQHPSLAPTDTPKQFMDRWKKE